MTIPPFPAPTPGDPDLPGPGLTPEERKDVKDNQAEERSAWAPSDPPSNSDADIVDTDDADG